MCGIYGCFMKKGLPSTEALAEAQSRLHHRGPDESGLFVENALALGHTRLSIIDLSTGQQPMTSADGRFVIVFNGEIYNFQDLRRQCKERGYLFQTHADTEVILSLYALKGQECVHDLRGMFAFAVYDRREKTLFLARDRIGVKPLLYGQNPEGFYFASELSALLALAPGLKEDLDYDALVDFFARQYILAPQTPYRGIRKLEPGHTLFIKEGEVRVPQRYWFLETTPRRQCSEAEAQEEFKDLLTEATKLRLISEVPLGAFLSGGVDSSITVALMARLLGKKFRTYCIGFKDTKFNESMYARSVAEHCGTEHEEMILEYNRELPYLVSRMINHFGEPFADSSMIPTFYVAQLARRELTVVLSGDGADETWGGYKRHYHAALFSILNTYGLNRLWFLGRRITASLERFLGHGNNFPANQLDWLLQTHKSSDQFLLCKHDTAEREELVAARELHRANRLYSFYRPMPANPDWNNFERFLFYDLRTFLVDDVLFKVDISTMMNSLEARSPFLDHKVIEFAFSLPLKLRRPRLKDGKSFLKRTFASLLPPGHFDRPKMGFSPPLSSWLRTLLKDWCGDLLGSMECKQWLNQTLLQQRFKQHQQGEDHNRLLWTAAVFCEWVRQRESRQ